MPIEANMMLCEAATQSGGGISLLGAGWQVRPAPAMTPCGIAVVLKIPRKQAGIHHLRLELLDYDGNLVKVEPPQGPGDMVIEAQIAVGGLQDPDLKTPLLGTFAVNLLPFPLEADREYQWRLHVDSKTRSAWTLPFRTMRPAEMLEVLGQIEALGQTPPPEQLPAPRL
jgi:hypothetical protein